MTKPLSQYLKDENGLGTTDFRLKICSTQAGAVQFCIHPYDKDGDTGDYFIIGNLTVPINTHSANQLESAIYTDCAGFKAPMPDLTCPKCHVALSSAYMSVPWFIRTEVAPPGKNYWEKGVQTCDICGHQFMVSTY